KQVVADLEAQVLLEKVEPYETDIGHSDRSKTPIQPYLSDQWFVKMGDVEGGITLGDGSKAPGLAQAAIDAICKEDAHYDDPEARKTCTKVHVFPRRYVNTYVDWLAEKRDWCISRQLWWGHRIPVLWKEMPAPGGMPGTFETDRKLDELSIPYYAPPREVAIGSGVGRARNAVCL